MKVVGVTGSIGAGKSAFAKLLAKAVERRGMRVALLDADRIARDLVENDPEAPAVRTALSDRFGADVLRADGSLDRAALAARAFADDDSAAALNAILHPRVFAAATRILGERAADGTGLAVLDVPLLFESGMDRLCGLTVAITAPRALRLGRAARFEDAAERERRQWSEEQKADHADVVVVNDATLAELAVHAAALAEKLLPSPR